MKHDFREKSEKKEAITAKKLPRLNEKEEDLKEKETTRKLSHVETSPEEIVDLWDWGEEEEEEEEPLLIYTAQGSPFRYKKVVCYQWEP